MGREMSPSRGSILMTSAPRSASNRPAVGPAMRLVISSTLNALERWIKGARLAWLALRWRL